MEVVQKTTSGWWFVLSALPLLIYPGIFVANIMSLAAIGVTDIAPLLAIVSQLFLWGTLAYPLVWIGCIVAFFVMKDPQSKGKAVRLPLWYLLVCVLLLLGWMGLGE